MPVDPYYLSYIASKNKFEMKVALAGRSVNNNMKNFVLKEFYENVKKNKIKKNSNILVVGLSYKYGVSDIRNSLNLVIFNEIRKKFKKTLYFDPFVNSINSLKHQKNYKIYKTVIFLSYGKKFLSLFKKLKVKKINILDPFKYYN